MMMDERPDSATNDDDKPGTGVKSAKRKDSPGTTEVAGSGETRRPLDGSGETR